MNLLITGVSGYVGQAVVRRLIRSNPFDRIFGVDLRPPRILGPVRYVPLDVRADELAELLVLDDIQVVLHLAFASGRFGEAHEERAVAKALLEGAELGELSRVVIASPDRVYRAGDPCAPADQPVCGMRGLKAEQTHPLVFEGDTGPTVVVLRVGNIIGPLRDGALDPFLSLPMLPAPAGPDPLVQLLHIDDAAEAFITAALHPDMQGSYDLAGTDPIGLSVVAGILQKPLIRPPKFALNLGVRALARTHLLPMGPTTVRALHHGIPLDTSALAALGYRPRYTTRQTLAVWRTGHTGGHRSRFQTLPVEASKR